MYELKCVVAIRSAALIRELGFALAVAVGLTTAAAHPALAHPHIWVTARTIILYENGAIVGLRQAWTFDEYYTAMAIDGLDVNKDGVYSREELGELAKVNVEALKEFSYFTFPRLGDQELAVGAPKDYYLEHSTRKAEPAPDRNKPVADAVLPRANDAPRDGAAPKAAKELTLHFTLPIAKPVLADARDFSFSLGDPAFFIAFEPAATDPVTLGEGAPKGCHAENLAPPKVPDVNPSKPGDLMASQPSDITVNVVSGPAWKVVCTPGG